MAPPGAACMRLAAPHCTAGARNEAMLRPSHSRAQDGSAVIVRALPQPPAHVLRDAALELEIFRKPSGTLMGIVGSWLGLAASSLPTMPTVSTRITTETRKALEGPLFLVQDGAPYHPAARVTAFFEQQRDRQFTPRYEGSSPAQLLARLQPDRAPLARHQTLGHPQPLLPRALRPDRLGRGRPRRLRSPAGPGLNALRTVPQAHGRA